MQQISHALSKPLSQLAPSTPGSVPLPVHMVEDLFTRLTAQLGVKVADLFAGIKPENVKAEWADGLAGFRDDEIMRGLKACQTRVFAPTLGEFCRLCRPALDAEFAWIEAVDGMASRRAGQVGQWSHPAVHRAAQTMTFELQSRSFNECRRAWGFRLEREFAKGWVEDVPPPAMRIEHQPGKARPPTAAEKAVFDMLRGKASDDPAHAKKSVEPGLPSLKALIAGAVADAGGDEVAELNRLDRMCAGAAA